VTGEATSSRGWAFVAFPLAIVFLFSALPSVLGVGLSFFELSGASELRFVGLGNFKAAFTQDPMLLAALRNSLLFAAGAVPATVFGGFLLAVALNASWFRGATVCRTLVFLPTVVSVVAIGYLWTWVLDSQSGLLNVALEASGVGPVLFPQGPPTWLGDSPWALAALMTIHVWRSVGFAMILYLAALSSVPKSHLEAVVLDGATPLQAMRYVTWPTVRPMTAFLLITGMIGALQIFDLVWIMTRGGGRWTTVVNVQLYAEFANNRLGYAAAIGGIVLVLTGAVTFVQLRYFKAKGAVA
jgi:multiple sugar transport system permease protein